MAVPPLCAAAKASPGAPPQVPLAEQVLLRSRTVAVMDSER